MKTFIPVLVAISSFIHTSYGQEFTIDKGNRDLMFDSVDIQILVKANDILIDESVWSKADDRKCLDDIEAKKYSLFCALYKASIDIIGEYNHRKPGLQQLRWIISDKYRHRYDDHRLMNFNNHPDTTFEEIRSLIAESIKVIEQKIAEG